MKSRYLLGAGAALAVAFGCADANAQFAWLGGPYPVAFYVGPEGGWTSLANQKETVTTPTFLVNGAGPFNTFNLSARYNNGFNAGGRLGIQYGPLRVEEEYSYRHNGLSSLGGFYGPNTNSLFQGQRNTNSIMTNFIYDFTIGWPVSPHIGFGVGAVNTNDSASFGPISSGGTPLIFTAPGVAGAAVIPPNSTLGGTLLKANGWNFGYQAIAGIRYDISPLIAFDVDYRYLATTEPTFSNKGVFPVPPAGFPPRTTRYTSGYNTQNIVASLTMKFGAPPPAPPPPAPPAPPPPPTHQVYLVFFDWDKYNITPEGQQIIQLAANQYHSGGRVTLQVTGYTDTSGSPGYNQRLSERRANAVAAALERLGVPRSDMVVAGRGENDLRVPTPPGVREPQNRCVEIVFP
jgi:outer membrane protein OmpA-like peptidoglycan-associated protein